MKVFLDKKRRFATVLLSAGLLCSCSEAYTPEYKQGAEGDEIGFQTITEKTRATQIDATNIADFKTWAVWQRGTNDFVSNYMEGVEVERQAGNWVYSPLRYWPAIGSVDFYGYSPAASTGLRSFAITGTKYDGVTIQYDATTDPITQEDFVVASALDKTSGQVTMNFQHALSQIEFRTRSGVKGVTFRLRSLELRNLDRAGTLTGTVPTVGAAELEWAWSGNTATAEKTETYAVYLPSPVASVYASTASAPPAYISLTDDAVGNMMILPQVVSMGSNERYTQADIDASDTDEITQGLIFQPKDLATKFYIVARIDSETNYYSGTGIIPFHVDAPLYIPLYSDYGADGKPGGGDDEPFEFKAGDKYTFMLELNDLNQVKLTIAESDWESWHEVEVGGL